VSPRAVYRFVNYRIAQDSTGEVSRSARCVSGEEADCGESSGELDEERVAKWMAEHAAATGHTRFRRTFTDYAVVEPKP
jgi:hypothetical protein